MKKKHKKIVKQNNKMMKALKAINSMSGKNITEKYLKRHRKVMERMGKLASSGADIRIKSLNVGKIRVERIRSKKHDKSQYAILYAHGGGFICGGIGYSRILAARLAVATGLAVYSVEYRLAPEDPYPAALNDMMQVWEFITEKIKKPYKPEHIFLAGDSAGGNLVLCMERELKANEKPLPGGLLLFSPWTDMTATSSSYDTYKDIDPILTRDYVIEAAKAYIAGAGEPGDVRFSPLFCDMEGVPPVYIMAGRNEILLDDSIRLHNKIIQSGGRSVLDIEENGWHVYQQMPIHIAEEAMKRLSAYVSSEINESDI